jgi:hypothetical protein
MAGDQGVRARRRLSNLGLALIPRPGHDCGVLKHDNEAEFSAKSYRVLAPLTRISMLLLCLFYAVLVNYQHYSI